MLTLGVQLFGFVHESPTHQLEQQRASEQQPKRADPAVGPRHVERHTHESHLRAERGIELVPYEPLSDLRGFLSGADTCMEDIRERDDRT